MKILYKIFWENAELQALQWMPCHPEIQETQIIWTSHKSYTFDYPIKEKI